MDTSEKLLNAVQVYVMEYLKDNLSSNLTFHNVNHTLEVVQAAREIASHYNLSEENLKLIQIAAWFHDCGYAMVYTGHESLSKQIAEDFLKEHNYPEKLITHVLNCIEATRYPQNPMTLESKILCDADLYHFARPNYNLYEHAIRAELELYFKRAYSDIEWARTNCEMLENHVYFTDYGKDVLQEFKSVNIARMKCRCH